MILDYEGELTYTAGPPALSKQTLIGNADTAINGGRVLNAGGAKDWGSGEIKTPYVRVVTAVAGASGGVKFQIVSSAALNLGTPTVLSERTIPTASLLINTIHPLPPLMAGTSRQYLGVIMTPLTSNCTAGEVVVGFIGKDGRPQGHVGTL
jgi:hypothetical protein